MFGQRLAKYLSEHKIEEKVNNCLNLALRTLPQNPYEEIARVLKLSTATKLSLLASPRLIGNGVTVRVITVQGFFESTVQFFDDISEISQSDARCIETGSDASTRILNEDVMSSVLEFVNNILSPRLKQIDPMDQEEIDRIMKEELSKYKPKDSGERPFLERAVLATSMAIMRAGSARNKSNLYEHISDVAMRTDEEYVIPLPLVSVLTGGTKSLNDLAVSEIIACPSGYKTFQEAYEAVRRFENSLQIIAPQKMGRVVDGGFTPFWTCGVDEVLSFACDAIKLCDSKDKMFLGIDVNAEALFRKDGDDDEDESYYDLSMNMRKTEESDKKMNDEEEDQDEDVDDDEDDRVKRCNPDQFLKVLSNWCEKYDVRVVVDPFVNNIDAMRHWTALKNLTFTSQKSKIESRVSVCAKSLLHVPEFKLPAKLKEGRYDVANVRLSEFVTISDAVKAVHEYQTKNIKVVLDNQNNDSFVADFCVALRCNMIRVHGFVGTSQQRVFQRLRWIENELLRNNDSKKKGARGGGIRCRFAGF